MGAQLLPVPGAVRTQILPVPSVRESHTVVDVR